MKEAGALEDDPVLGPVVASFPSDRIRALVLAGVAALAIGLLLNFTVAALPDWWAAPLTIILSAATVLGLGWYVLHIWNREVILYMRGFTIQEGARSVPFLYAEIAAVRLRAERLRYFGGLMKRDVYEYTLTTQADEQFSLSGGLYRRAPELGTRLTEKINAILVPRLWEQFNSGASLVITPAFSIGRDGLRNGDRTLSWADFAGHSLSSGELVLRAQSGEWLRLPLSELNNVTFLLDVLHSQES